MARLTGAAWVSHQRRRLATELVEEQGYTEEDARLMARESIREAPRREPESDWPFGRR